MGLLVLSCGNLGSVLETFAEQCCSVVEHTVRRVWGSQWAPHGELAEHRGLQRREYFLCFLPSQEAWTFSLL